MAADPPRRATAADLAALPEDVSAELVGGLLLPLPIPSFAHGDVVATLTELLAPWRSARGGGPGGWWMASSVDIELGPNEVHCPDLVGWRWERSARRPTGSPVTLRPDWICEVLSPATARRDRVEKLRALHQVGVPSYWLVDPADQTLTVMRWQAEGYLITSVSGGEDRVHAEPFGARALSLVELFGGAETGSPARSTFTG